MILLQDRLFAVKDYFELFVALEAYHDKTLLFILNQIKQYPCDTTTKSCILLFVLCYLNASDQLKMDQILYWKEWICNKLQQQQTHQIFNNNAIDYAIVFFEKNSRTTKKALFISEPFIVQKKNTLITSVQELEQFKEKQEEAIENYFTSLIYKYEQMDTIVMNQFHEFICYYCKKYNKSYIVVKSSIPLSLFDYNITNSSLLTISNNITTPTLQQQETVTVEATWKELLPYSWFQKYLSYISTIPSFDRYTCYSLAWELLWLVLS